MSGRVHIDSFSGRLGDLPRKMRRNHDAVLDVLRDHPRFTVFDIDAPLAKTLDELGAMRRLKYDKSEEYPWCRVDVMPPHDQCPTCRGSGGVATGYSGKWKHRACRQCEGTGWVPRDMTRATPAPGRTEP